jgi:hypothetical protein
MTRGRVDHSIAAPNAKSRLLPAFLWAQWPEAMIAQMSFEQNPAFKRVPNGACLTNAERRLLPAFGA